VAGIWQLSTDTSARYAAHLWTIPVTFCHLQSSTACHRIRPGLAGAADGDAVGAALPAAAIAYSDVNSAAMRTGRSKMLPTGEVSVTTACNACNSSAVASGAVRCTFARTSV
jgi:hypothetical protein